MIDQFTNPAPTDATMIRTNTGATPQACLRGGTKPHSLKIGE